MARQAPLAVRRHGMSSTPSLEHGEGATQTFKRGALLVNSAGYLIEASANPRSIIGVAEEAGENGTNAGDKNVRYAPVIPGLIFEFTLAKASDLGNYALVAADMFKEYGVTKDADGLWYLDVDKTTGGTNTIAVIVGFRGAVGDKEARVYAEFLYEVMFRNSA